MIIPITKETGSKLIPEDDEVATGTVVVVLTVVGDATGVGGRLGMRLTYSGDAGDSDTGDDATSRVGSTGPTGPPGGPAEYDIFF